MKGQNNCNIPIEPSDKQQLKLIKIGMGTPTYAATIRALVDMLRLPNENDFELGQRLARQMEADRK